MRFFAALILLAACGGSPPPPARTPGGAAATPADEPPPATTASVPPPRAVPPAPAECDAFAAPAASCGAEPVTLADVARAFESDDALARDRQLACLEARSAPLEARLRELRADLAPLGCADRLVDAFFESRAALLQNSRVVDDTTLGTLRGLGIAARLSRLVGKPPELAPPFDKPRFFEFFERELKPWIIAEAQAIGALSLGAAALTGYGKAVSAVEAGLADLRFVQAVRAVALPAELAADPEVKNVYYAALDEALEPRKARGRDAALVALRLFAELGALVDPRVERARRLLSAEYAGSRLDALDRLLLPELAPISPGTPAHALAAKLPTYHAARLLHDAADPRDPALLRAYLERGFPAPLRAALDAPGLGAEARYLYAFAEVRRGIVYFSGPAFQRAHAILGTPTNDGERLLSALAQSLAGAPKDAATLMLSAPRLAQPLGPVEALETHAASQQRYAAEAELDAAYLRSLTPPDNDAKFWRDLERRFRRAEKGLKRDDARRFARELAESAAATAKALGKR